jgi:hypothetical protein
MGDDETTKSGSVPDPIPEVRDEGPGGSDLSFSESSDVESSEGTGAIPHPTPRESIEGVDSTD